MMMYVYGSLAFLLWSVLMWLAARQQIQAYRMSVLGLSLGAAIATSLCFWELNQQQGSVWLILGGGVILGILFWVRVGAFRRSR